METNLKLLRKLLVYADRYEISIQFWPDQTSVFIAKDGIELDGGWGASDKDFAIKKALEYLNRINKKNKSSGYQTFVAGHPCDDN